jgi:glycosyltransferase involved in cell wall biosynthesis
MRVLFALPGLHKIDRGAEVAFISVANELAKAGCQVTLVGSGQARRDTRYHFSHVGSIARDYFRSFPSLPALRDDCAYEELTFAADFMFRYRPSDYDVTVTCSYPFTNWILRRPTLRGRRPPHVFVTENGDWAAYSNESEYRLFGCEGLVCTNPDFYERNRGRWRARLIPNGVDCARFSPGPHQRSLFGLPQNQLVVLMVSALIPSKRVDVGIESVSQIPNAHLVVAGDGPMRKAIEAMAVQRLPGRFTLLSVPSEKMPSLYRSADVFLHLSKEEAFGNVYLEAMACGLPIVAHDSPHVRWIVGDEEFLVDTGQAADISAGLIRAGNTPLANRQSRVNKAGLFSWTKIGAMYQEFLQEIVTEWNQH